MACERMTPGTVRAMPAWMNSTCTPMANTVTGMMNGRMTLKLKIVLPRQV